LVYQEGLCHMELLCYVVTTRTLLCCNYSYRDAWHSQQNAIDTGPRLKERLDLQLRLLRLSKVTRQAMYV
jgi:hypothetical protein